MAVSERVYASPFDRLGYLLELSALYARQDQALVRVTIHYENHTKISVSVNLSRADALKMYHALGDVLVASTPPMTGTTEDQPDPG